MHESEPEPELRYRQKPLGRSGWMIILAAILLVVVAQTSTWMTAHTAYENNLEKATASQNWSTTSGTITDLKVRQVMISDSGRYSKSQLFEPKITYTYVVQGKSFTQSQVSFPNPDFFNAIDAVNYLDQYQLGDSVKVFYDPKNPNRSCLINGITDKLKSDIFWIIKANHMR